MKRPSMKVLNGKPKLAAWSMRYLPVAIGGLAIIGLVVACGKQGGGKEVISRGNTPPPLGKISARKHFSRPDDAALAERLVGVSAAAIPDSTEAKEIEVTVSFLVVDPTNAKSARKVIASRVIPAGKPQVAAPAAPGVANPAPAAGPVTAPAPTRASRSTKAQGGAHNLSEIGHQLALVDPANVPPTDKAEGLPGQSLAIDKDRSSKTISEGNYRIQAVCDDPSCNNLHILLAEQSQEKKLTITLVFNRSTPEGAFKIVACPADPGDNRQAAGSQSFALRAHRGNTPVNANLNAAATIPGAKCQEIMSFEAALKSAGQNQVKVMSSASETDVHDPEAVMASEQMISDEAAAAKHQTKGDVTDPLVVKKDENAPAIEVKK